MTFRFSRRSRNALVGVHHDLVRVITATLDVSPVDFGIIQGVRTSEQQHAYFLEGKSQLDDPPQPGKPRGRHVTGHAVDFAAWRDGAFSWDEALLKEVSDAAKICAKHLNIKIVWGGDWAGFTDMDHIELDRATYPDEPLIA